MVLERVGDYAEKTAGVLLTAALLATAARAAPPVARDKTITVLEGATAEVKLEIDPATAAVAEWEVISKPADVTGTPPQLTYAPKNFTGLAALTFRVKTVEGELSNVATVTLKVESPPTPALRNLEIQVTEDTEKEFLLDIDYAGKKEDLVFTVAKADEPKHGTVPATGDASKPLKYKATTPNYLGSDSFKVSVRDTKTGRESAKATVSIASVSASAKVQQLVDSAKNTLPGQYNPENIRAEAHCKLTTETLPGGGSRAVHTCDPTAISVTAAAASTVIVDLPAGIQRVTATANEHWGVWEQNNSHTVLFTGGPSADRCPYDTAPGDIKITIHRQRALKPSYKEPGQGQADVGETELRFYRTAAKAAAYTRPKERTSCNLSLVVTGHTDILGIDLVGSQGGVPYAYTLNLRMLFHQWLVDIAGFYALRTTGDRELITEAVPAAAEGSSPMTRVLRINTPDETTESGIMLNFFKANYPKLGVAFGFAFPAGRSPSYYLGFSYRLNNSRHSAVATFSAGITATEILTYPGIEAGGQYGADSALLKGSTDYTNRLFASITLGFALPNKSG
jgi:hypothetical protein